MKAMIFEDRSGEDLETYIQDPLFVFEQKFDGARLLAKVDPATHKVDFRQRNGKPMKFAAAALHLERLAESVYTLSSLFSKDFQESNPEGFWLDGEIIPETGTYHVWDVVPSGTFEKYPAYARRSFLERAFEERELSRTPERLSAPLKLVRQAHTPGEKRSLAEATVATGSEGFVVKDQSKPYSPGVRVKHSFKVKHVKTAEAFILSWEKGLNFAGRPTGSARIGITLADGSVRDIGSTSLIGKAEVKNGDVIEFKYLYWTGEAPIQPRMIRARPDKTPADCTIEQFPAYTREEILWN